MLLNKAPNFLNMSYDFVDNGKIKKQKAGQR